MIKPAASDSDSGSAPPRSKHSLGRVLLVEDDAVLAMSLEDALLEGGAKEAIIWPRCSGRYPRH